MIARSRFHARRHRIAIIGLAAVVTCAACGSTTSPSSTDTAATVDTYSSILQPKGSVSRSIQAKAGTVTLQLSSMSPNDVAVGVGLGQYDASGGCAMTSSVVTIADASTPQITADLQTGTYCVRLYDVGTLVSAVTFTVSITHP
jgi:hypothetical protein